jgi:glucan 1,3-beta-glucosidase
MVATSVSLPSVLNVIIILSCSTFTGAWLAVENTLTPTLFSDGGAPGVPDEWTFCQTVGKEACGAVLEDHYANFITTADIDKLATVGINTLRITTTYAAWIDVPGSWLHHGNQQQYLRTITNYAISRYGMHIVLGLHSLPGEFCSYVSTVGKRD